MSSERAGGSGQSDSLIELAARLREEETPISGHVAPAPHGEGYDSFILDSVREGYLLHYGEPRLLAGHDDDLALLAGDYLYALGIERLAALGDTAAVLVLAELIGDCAQAHAEGREEDAPALWQAAAAAIADSPAASQ
jgi:hypothetical protein